MSSSHPTANPWTTQILCPSGVSNNIVFSGYTDSTAFQKVTFTFTNPTDQKQHVIYLQSTGPNQHTMLINVDGTTLPSSGSYTFPDFGSNQWIVTVFVQYGTDGVNWKTNTAAQVNYTVVTTPYNTTFYVHAEDGGDSDYNDVIVNINISATVTDFTLRTIRDKRAYAAKTGKTGGYAGKSATAM